MSLTLAEARLIMKELMQNPNWYESYRDCRWRSPISRSILDEPQIIPILVEGGGTPQWYIVYDLDVNGNPSLYFLYENNYPEIPTYTFSMCNVDTFVFDDVLEDAEEEYPIFNLEDLEANGHNRAGSADSDEQEDFNYGLYYQRERSASLDAEHNERHELIRLGDGEPHVLQ